MNGGFYLLHGPWPKRKKIRFSGYERFQAGRPKGRPVWCKLLVVGLRSGSCRARALSLSDLVLGLVFILPSLSAFCPICRFPCWARQLFSILVFCLSCCQSLLAVCMSAFVRAIRLHRLGMLNQDHNEIMFTNIRYYQNLVFLEYPPLVLIAGDIAYSWNPCLRPILVLHYVNKCSCSCDVCWYLQARHRFKENHGSRNEEEEPTLGSYLHKSNWL